MITKNLRYANLPNKPVRSCCIGGSLENGPRHSTNRYVLMTGFLIVSATYAHNHYLGVLTDQLNIIVTYDEIVEHPIPSELSNLPIPILKKAAAILAMTTRTRNLGNRKNPPHRKPVPNPITG